MKTMVTRRHTAIVIPNTSRAYFTAAGLLAFMGLLLLAAEQE